MEEVDIMSDRAKTIILIVCILIIMFLLITDLMKKKKQGVLFPSIRYSTYRNCHMSLGAIPMAFIFCNFIVIYTFCFNGIME